MKLTCIIRPEGWYISHNLKTFSIGQSVSDDPSHNHINMMINICGKIKMKNYRCLSEKITCYGDAPFTPQRTAQGARVVGRRGIACGALRQTPAFSCRESGVHGSHEPIINKKKEKGELPRNFSRVCANECEPN